MIKAVIFDLNGIFIQSPKLSSRFEWDFNVPINDFLPKLSEIMDKVRQPNAGPSFDYWSPVLKEWNINLSEKEFWDYWFKSETVSEPMIEFAKGLKSKSVRVFILSNNFKERAEYYAQYPWMQDVIDQPYFSWQTGLVKPNPEAWMKILADHNLKPEECLYFDDQEKNVAAATSTGITSYMFTTEANLMETVTKHL
jgi:glucose-1-phosphatase